MKLKRFWRVGTIGVISILLIGLSVIPLRLSIAVRQAPQPEAILVLGGDAHREEIGAHLAQHNPDLQVWVSTGEAPKISRAIFRSAGIADDRVHLDYRASDTVTNFTSLVADFRRQGIQHLYVVTSDFHMPRARVIGTIVLGSNGIAFTPVTVPTGSPRESWIRIVRDGGRSVLWLATGRTGASFREVIEAHSAMQ
ncbi:YdcF family protein [Egbenema bharatensis]|uniref:YdcF family protein n=1 Tax=Egbenema bharatensis TaxID=3463334 RepID=UPI003A8B06CA